MKKLKELIARIKTAKGEEKAAAFKEIKGISCIVNTKPAETNYWPE